MYYDKITEYGIKCCMHAHHVAPRAPPSRGKLYRRKTLFLDDFPIFFFIQMGPGPTHPLPNYFWIFGIFLTLQSPLSECGRHRDNRRTTIVQRSHKGRCHLQTHQSASEETETLRWWGASNVCTWSTAMWDPTWTTTAGDRTSGNPNCVATESTCRNTCGECSQRSRSEQSPVEVAIWTVIQTAHQIRSLNFVISIFVNLIPELYLCKCYTGTFDLWTRRCTWTSSYEKRDVMFSDEHYNLPTLYMFITIWYIMC